MIKQSDNCKLIIFTSYFGLKWLINVFSNNCRKWIYSLTIFVNYPKYQFFVKFSRNGSFYFVHFWHYKFPYEYTSRFVRSFIIYFNVSVIVCLFLVNCKVSHTYLLTTPRTIRSHLWKRVLFELPHVHSNIH